jgi:hypothetical protein
MSPMTKTLICLNLSIVSNKFFMSILNFLYACIVIASDQRDGEGGQSQNHKIAASGFQPSSQ